MSGLFPGICNTQNIDANGKPLAGAVLTVYNGGTLQFSSVFQDIGLAIPGRNPMTADLTGRLPLFYVADGVYRVRLVDATGILIFDYPQLASIGASSSGGGGSAVDPTTIFQTGDDLWSEIGGLRTGWVRQNALTIGSATSGGSERANSDCQNLFLYLWNNYPDSKCPVVGGRGATAAADWAANKQITMPDKRGRGPIGQDGMGNARANVLPDSNVTSGGGDGGDTNAAFGGIANQMARTTIAQANLPNVNFPVTLTDPGHAHTGVGNFRSISANLTAGAAETFGGTGSTTSDPATTGITASVSSGGSGLAAVSSSFSNTAPFVVGCWYKKL